MGAGSQLAVRITGVRCRDGGTASRPPLEARSTNDSGNSNSIASTGSLRTFNASSMRSAISDGESVKNKIDDLRNHLFETLEDLRDKENPMEVERAKAIAAVAQVIVNSAKAENEFIDLTGSNGTGFIEEPRPIAKRLTA